MVAQRARAKAPFPRLTFRGPEGPRFHPRLKARASTGLLAARAALPLDLLVARALLGVA
jgi:hypothetical protein